MPSNETPPNSPCVCSNLNDDDEEANNFNENDIAEIVEDDVNNVDDDDGDAEDEVVSEEEAGGIEISPERDDAQTIFSEHEGGVLSCDFHPTSPNIVATGGLDDNAFVWDATNGNKLFMCKGHEESVEIVSFSYDGSYLATADLHGIIQVWRTSDFKLIAKFEIDDECSWLQWHTGTNVLVACSLIGMIYMYKLPSGERKMVLAPFGQNCLAGKILSDGRSLACGFKNGNLKIVDLKQGSVLKDVKSFDELGGITCLDAHKNNLIICGYESGAVVLINSSNGKIASVLQGSQDSENCSYVEAVAFCKDPSYQVAASASLGGSLIIWDIVRQSLRHKHNFSSCINHIAWHPSLPLLFTCHFEGAARVYDAKAGVVLKEYLGHQKSCLNMSLSRDGSLLVTTSEDKTARIFSVSDIV